MAFKNKNRNTVKKLTRKQKRKEMRKDKKVRRNEFHSKKKMSLPSNPQENANTDKTSTQIINQNQPKDTQERTENISVNQVPTTEQLRKKEKKEQKRIEKEMLQQRKKQLLEANIEEDRIIQQMEKHLGLKKRKSKSLPGVFKEDGLDYLLEICEPEMMRTAAAADQDINEANDDFEEDFELMTKQPSREPESKDENNSDLDRDSSGEMDENDFEEDESRNQYYSSDSESEELEITTKQEKKAVKKAKTSRSSDEDDNRIVKSPEKLPKKRKQIESPIKRKKPKLDYSDSETEIFESDEDSPDIADINEDDSDENEDGSDENEDGSDENEDGSDENEDGSDENENGSDNKSGSDNDDGTWEDIYGRKRGKDGSIITDNQSKYIPPAMRGKLNDGPEDKKRTERLNRLKRQLKGYINRLAESNMHHISTQIEELYMNNSRNDMNDTLTTLMMESLVSGVMSPERLLIEHVVLLTILHANVGTEVGAHFLQHVIQKFQEYFTADQEVENKKLDNVVCIIAQLYNFKLFDSKLIYDVLKKFVGKFKEKDVECILHILKSIGFTLRKEDPLSLKNLILAIQNQASNVSDEEKDNSRVKFMLDILLAIKNNNVSKIPNYDTSYSEHMKKIMKGFIRKGNYVTQLNISLEDLLKADERGRWWVVGSAWTGNQAEGDDKSNKITKSDRFSAKLLELARKQRMNTDTRRNLFCIMMSAEDYMDAFEKIVKLGLKNQEERDIINVLIHCCLQEKNYNPYYGFLAQKFCDMDRKYQVTIKYSIWDKLKSLSDHSGSQISNLAKLLIHLFIEKGLPISTLKIVQFSELEKLTLRFMRQILLGILLHENVESCLAVFAKVAQSDKLKLFRESLRLFIHHFLLRNLKSEKVPGLQKELLETRAKMVERLLSPKS